MCSHLLVCADPAQKSRCLQDASTSHGEVGPCPMQCLLCTACPACDVALMNALLCVHGARACIVLLLLVCSCKSSLTTLAGLHVAMLFEWCGQTPTQRVFLNKAHRQSKKTLPSGHVGPPATAGNKRWLAVSQDLGRSTHMLSAPNLISVSIGLIIACLLSTAARPSVRAVGIAQCSAYFARLTMPCPAQWLWGVRNSPGRWEGHCQPPYLHSLVCSPCMPVLDVAPVAPSGVGRTPCPTKPLLSAGTTGLGL